MVSIRNTGFENFKRITCDKEIVIFGAGRALDSCMDTYFEDKEVSLIIDNNPSLWNTTVEYNNHTYQIQSIDELIKAYKNNNDLICLIDSPFFAYEIVNQMDKLDSLEGMICYLHVFIRNTSELIKPYEFTKGKMRIPKKIHYIWVGNSELPKQYLRNIETWRLHNPDYEIVCWNEKNYDFHKDEYTREAYKSKNWGFVPNLARLDIVSKEGGIYLDVDVEAVASFDKLLNDDAFFNMGCANAINRGCGFGAIKGAVILDEMKNAFFENQCLDEKGNFIKRQDHIYAHPVLKRKGFSIVNQFQRIDSVVKYPSEVMSPLTLEGFENLINEKTVSIHHEMGVWKTDKEVYGSGQIYSIYVDRVVNEK